MTPTLLHKNPLVSVVLVSFNRAGYLLQSVQSIMAQTMGDFELIVVLDGSTDDSWRNIQQLHDKRIILCHCVKNRGIAFARNTALHLARGQFIAVHDDDDVARPNRLEIQTNIFEKQPHLSVISGSMSIFHNDDIHNSTSENSRELNHDILAPSMFFNCAISNPTSMYRRKIHSELGYGYDEDLPSGEDFDLWLRLIMNEKPMPQFYAHPDIIIDYRRHGAAMSRNILAPWFVQLRHKIYMRALLKMGIIPTNEQFQMHRALTDGIYKLETPESSKIFDPWFELIRKKNKQLGLFHEGHLVNAMASHVYRCAQNAKLPSFKLFGKDIPIQ